MSKFTVKDNIDPMNTKVWFRKIRSSVLVLAAGLGLPMGVLADSPDDDELNEHHSRVKAVLDVQTDVTPGLMGQAGVLGTAVAVEDTGETTLIVYVDQDSPGRGRFMRGLPPQFRGVGVRVELTEKFRAYAGNTAKQTPPIQLGTSGGWSRDIANGYCCGGTLGSLVKVNGAQYLLSNYHVMESDIVPGGNALVAATGDTIIQPGLIDAGCSVTKAQTVGSLVRLSSLPASNVDVGIAAVFPGMVNTSGSILGIGTISASTVSASLRQAVKKSGRTTGLTTSKVTGLNATVSVAYQNECAGGAAFTKTFTGQIVVANSGNTFLNSGDSGSLLVENTKTNPRAVGLLFAGSSTSAIANPIGQVLQFLSTKLGGTVTMVGK